MNIMREEYRVIGTIVKDAEIIESETAQAIVYPIAINHQYKNKSGEVVKFTNFYDTAKWYPKGKNIQKIVEYLKKGAEVLIIGQPKSSAYIKKETGEPVGVIRIVVQNFSIIKFADNQIDDPVLDTEDLLHEIDYSPEEGDLPL